MEYTALHRRFLCTDGNRSNRYKFKLLATFMRPVLGSNNMKSECVRRVDRINFTRKRHHLFFCFIIFRFFRYGIRYLGRSHCNHRMYLYVYRHILSLFVISLSSSLPFSATAIQLEQFESDNYIKILILWIQNSYVLRRTHNCVCVSLRHFLFLLTLVAYFEYVLFFSLVRCRTTPFGRNGIVQLFVLILTVCYLFVRICRIIGCCLLYTHLHGIRAMSVSLLSN